MASSARLSDEVISSRFGYPSARGRVLPSANHRSVFSALGMLASGAVWWLGLRAFAPGRLHAGQASPAVAGPSLAPDGTPQPVVGPRA